MKLFTLSSYLLLTAYVSTFFLLGGNSSIIEMSKSPYKISANVVVNDGQLSIKVQKEKEEPVYEKENISVSDDFDIDIEESGTYTVTVTGKKTSGSVKFIVENN